MRIRGEITRWNDEKGFGFISSNGDASSVFVHIKAFSLKSRRPDVEDSVSYELAKDKSGRPRAEKVRFLHQTQPKKQSIRRNQKSAFPILFVLLFFCFICFSAYLERIPWLVVVLFFAMSVSTFFAYALDKSAARLGNWRTAESSLHFMGLVGGWPGALAAQSLLRHKSSKQEFLFLFWVTVFLNVTAIGYLVWSGNLGFINQLTDGFWHNVKLFIGSHA